MVEYICSSKTKMEFDVEDEKPGTSVSDDEMSETEKSEGHVYKVLGHDTFVDLKKIQ